MPHTYTVDLYTKSEGKFGYAFSNIRNYDELNAAIKERFPDVLNWKNPRRNKPFNGLSLNHKCPIFSISNGYEAIFPN